MVCLLYHVTGKSKCQPSCIKTSHLDPRMTPLSRGLEGEGAVVIRPIRRTLRLYPESQPLTELPTAAKRPKRKKAIPPLHPLTAPRDDGVPIKRHASPIFMPVGDTKIVIEVIAMEVIQEGDITVAMGITTGITATTAVTVGAHLRNTPSQVCGETGQEGDITATVTLIQAGTRHGLVLDPPRAVAALGDRIGGEGGGTAREAADLVWQAHICPRRQDRPQGYPDRLQGKARYS